MTTADRAAICVTCGVQHAGEGQPDACAICDDERQYVGWDGQRWTTLAAMQGQFANEFIDEEPGLTGIVTRPAFAIGQRALLVQTPAGNLLWDCITFLDDETIMRIEGRGGVSAIAISHPHFYGTCVAWSEACGGVPIYIHHDDSRWVMRQSPHLVLWPGEEIAPLPGLRLLRLGGHFPGSTVCYWPAGAKRRGVVLGSDTIAVAMDRRFVSIMYSYPNEIPLSAAEVRRIADRMREFRFDRIYGGFARRVVQTEARAALDRSVARYVRRVTGE